jgi:hypothetical protein
MAQLFPQEYFLLSTQRTGSPDRRTQWAHPMGAGNANNGIVLYATPDGTADSACAVNREESEYPTEYETYGR